MRYIILSYIILNLVVVIFSGCGSKIVYKEVQVPIKCDIEPAAKPTYSNDLETDLQNILIYDEILQSDLKACIGE